jgi:hypothetical protein
MAGNWASSQASDKLTKVHVPFKISEHGSRHMRTAVMPSYCMTGSAHSRGQDLPSLGECIHRDAFITRDQSQDHRHGEYGKSTLDWRAQMATPPGPLQE